MTSHAFFPRPHSAATPRRHAPHGFTLIELLVVISIIALLVAIVLPVLSTARETSRSVACLSNIRQMGMLAMIYANENDNIIVYDVYSDPQANSEIKRRIWLWTLASYLDVGTDFSGHYLTTDAGGSITSVKPGWNALDDAILSGLSVFECPSQKATFRFGFETQYGINFRSVSRPDVAIVDQWLRFDQIYR